jgi:hypothetical protein
MSGSLSQAVSLLEFMMQAAFNFKKYVSAQLLLLVLVITACGFVGPPDSGTSPSAFATLQSVVDDMAALTRELEPPEHLLQEEAMKTGDEFDVNAYFQVLDRLSMEPRYVLDYVYRYDELGGEPVLYARRADEPAHATYADYVQAVDEPRDAYLDHVQVDGTEESFFQLIVLRIMGPQFYLWWHGNHNDTTIIADRARLPDLLSTTEEFCGPLSPDTQQQANALNFDPVVELQDTVALVEVVTFTKWGGFMRTSYSISRSFPHQILQEQTEIILPYHCEVAF